MAASIMQKARESQFQMLVTVAGRLGVIILREVTQKDR